MIPRGELCVVVNIIACIHVMDLLIAFIKSDKPSLYEPMLTSAKLLALDQELNEKKLESDGVILYE